MAFYRYTMPLLFAVGVLTQLLVIAPAWRAMKKKTMADRINVIIDLGFICILFAFGIAYTIWDLHMGINRLVKLTGFLSAVQMVYWFINLMILYLIE